MTSYLGLLALAALFAIFGYVSGTWRHRDSVVRQVGFGAMGLIGAAVVVEIIVGVTDTTLVAPGTAFVAGTLLGFLLVLPGLYRLIRYRG